MVFIFRQTGEAVLPSPCPVVAPALGRALLRKGHARGCGKNETEVTPRKAPERWERSPAFKPCSEERFPSGQDARGPFSSQNAPARGVGRRALLKLSGLVLVPLPVRKRGAGELNLQGGLEGGASWAARA